MATREAFAEQLFATGELESATFRNADLDANASRIVISCGRGSFGALPADATVVWCEVWISLDSGVTWRKWCGFSTQGGARTTTGGVTLQRSSMGYFLPGAGDARRRVRVRIRTARALVTDVRIDTDDRGLWSTGAPPASVAYDAGADTSNGTGTNSLTVSATIAANDDRLLVAHVGINSFPASEISPGITSVVFNTTETMTQVSYDVHSDSPNNVAAATYARVAPTATTANVVLTLGGTMDRVHLGWSSYYGVDQATPYGTLGKTTNGTGTAVTGSCTGVADGMSTGYAFVAWSTGATSITDDAGHTPRWEEDAFGTFCSASMGTRAGAGSNAFAWTIAGSGSAQWITHSLPLNPVSAAGGHPAQRRTGMVRRGGRPVEIGREGGFVMRRAA